MPAGLPGCDSSDENPLSRSVRQLLEEGKPFPRLSMCFFDPKTSPIRWLGVLVHSAGDRILFFPGYAQTPTTLQTFVGDSQTENRPFVFDHVSLERDLQSWHVTTPRSTDHVGRPKTLPLGHSRVLWFGLSAASDQALRPVLIATRVTGNLPPSDAQRRIQAFMAARDGAEFPMFSLNTDIPRRKPPSFLHFSFVVGPAGFPDYDGTEIAAPIASPYVSPSLPPAIPRLASRRHRIRLSGSIELQITATELPGSLSVPITITGASANVMPQQLLAAANAQA